MERALEASQPICRQGGVGDRAYITDLAAETFADFGDYRTIIAQWLDAPRVVSLIAVEGRERLGFALIARHRSIGFRRRVFAELVAIAVQSGHRGTGLGRRLLEAAEQIARDWDASEVRLHTAESNALARSFFARAGYDIRTEVPTFYPNGQLALELHRSLR